MKKKIMNNEKMNQIISDAWANYSKKVIANNLQLIPAIDLPKTQEEFINKCKINPEFSERWGLKIEERELSRKERSDYYYKNGNKEGIVEGSLDRPIWEDNEFAHKWYDERNVPTKLITITYNGTKIESYE
jgi:broad specificity polyphosphatase/5'/3'-nucleotidase SurE